jgi:hypothetical protein
MSLTPRVVRLRRKRYHPLHTLQTQGRMHVQMKSQQLSLGAEWAFRVRPRRTAAGQGGLG